jgi:hypothetical protein
MIILVVLFVWVDVLAGCVIWLILALRETNRAIEQLRASRSE